MGSAKAHGFMIAGVINDHVLSSPSQVMEPGELIILGLDPENTSDFCPRCCGPCAAFMEYFNTPRGRAEADSYVRALGSEGGGYIWQTKDRGINWKLIEVRMCWGWCLNHADAYSDALDGREQ